LEPSAVRQGALSFQDGLIVPGVGVTTPTSRRSTPSLTHPQSGVRRPIWAQPTGPLRAPCT
jgi:hypothetical protein